MLTDSELATLLSEVFPAEVALISDHLAEIIQAARRGAKRPDELFITSQASGHVDLLAIMGLVMNGAALVLAYEAMRRGDRNAEFARRDAEVNSQQHAELARNEAGERAAELKELRQLNATAKAQFEQLERMTERLLNLRSGK
jgi:glucose dehydrogenase